MTRPSVTRFHSVLAGLLLALVAGSGHAQALDLDRLPSVTVEIITAAGDTHRLPAWVVSTREQRARGLMHVPAMPAGRGMLFLYPEADFVSMWMKNTLIPLDMLFIAPDGRITDLAADTAPQSLRVIPSSAPVTAVLELNAGTARRLGIRPGDRVTYPPPAAGLRD